MDEMRNGVYLGIDLNEKYTMISFYQLHMEEPQTLSTIMGSEDFQIPTFLAKKKGIGQWFIGQEAKQHVQMKDAEGVDHLLAKAIAGEDIYLEHEKYTARELLLLFLKKILALTGRPYTSLPVDKITFSMEHVGMEVMELILGITSQLGFTSHQIMLLDRSESFYYYALNQKPDVFIHDVLLFDYTSSDLLSCLLQRNIGTTPQMITLTNANHGKLLDAKDSELTKIAKNLFAGHTVSAVYLVGDGFDGDWMKLALQELCQNRKVFMGKNLYSKGACFAGAIKSEKKDWPFVYIGTNELKLNLYLKTIVRNEMQFHTLITAGESWYESKGECEVILDGTPEVEFWIQKPDSREAYVEVLELSDLPVRERRTTRLRITATPKSDRDIKVCIKDLGFGEIVPSTNKIWEHTMSLQ